MASTAEEGAASAGLQSGGRWRPTLLLALSLLLALLPAYFVVRDRWLQRPVLAEHLAAYARRFPFLQNFYLPAYVVAIAAVEILLIGLLFFDRGRPGIGWRRRIAFARRPRAARVGRVQRLLARALQAVSAAGLLALLGRAAASRGRALPGWELAPAILLFLFATAATEIPAGALPRLWRRNAWALLSILLAHATLLRFLASHYGDHRLELGFALLALAAAVNLAFWWRRTGPAPWIVLGAILLFTWNVNEWWYVVIGDEYSFWDAAFEIASGKSTPYFLSNVFRMGGGVFFSHPLFSSSLHAITMKLFGLNSFGWRLSSLYLAALSIGFFLRFFRTFLTRRLALAAAALLAVSHYLMSFGKIGYNNLQALFAMSLVLSSAAWVARTRRPLAWLCLGLSMASCFWVYPAALYVLPLAFLMILLYAPPRSGRAIAGWLMSGAGLLMWIFPLLFQAQFFESKIPGTFFFNPAITKSFASVAAHFASNLAYAAFSPWIIPEESHFVVASYLDPVTAALFGIGLAGVLWRVGRDRFALFLIAGLAELLFFAGATHDRTHPSATRMFLLLPFWALLAAVGLSLLAGWLRSAAISPRAATGFAASLVVVALAANLFQAYWLSPRRSIQYQSFESLSIRIARRAEELAPAPPKKIVIVAEPYWEPEGLERIRSAYGSPPRPSQIGKVTANGGHLPADQRAALVDRNSLVIVRPEMDPQLRKPLEEEIAGLGKIPCPVRTTMGEVRFNLWESPGLPRLCE